jgi:hypothetical protein
MQPERALFYKRLDFLQGELGLRRAVDDCANEHQDLHASNALIPAPKVGSQKEMS